MTMKKLQKMNRRLRQQACWLVVCVGVFWSPPSTAQHPFSLNGKEDNVSLGRHLYLLEDVDRSYSIEALTTPPLAGHFKKSEVDKPNFGFTKSAFWVRFALSNPTAEAMETLLELNYPVMDSVALFTPNGQGGFDKQILGDQHPFQDRQIAHRNPVFLVKLPARTQKTYYMRLTSQGSMQIPLRLHAPLIFFNKDHNHQMVFGAYFGLVLVMGIYNLFLFLSIRDFTYLSYCIYILAVSFFNFSLSGYSYEYFFGNAPFWANVCVSFAGFFISSANVLFSILFLKTKENSPRIHKFFVFWLILLTAAMGASLFVPYASIIKVLAVSTVITATILNVAGIYIWVKGYRPARFYVIAWVPYLTGCFMQAARLLGLIPSMFITEYGMEIGSALEVVFLSFALADRINIMKAEKEQAQQEAIDNYHKADRIKDEFLANTSHELRTPLHGIVGLSEALIQGARGELSPLLVRDLSMIAASGRRLTTLVNDILDLSKMKHHDIVLSTGPVSLDGLINLVVTLCEPTKGKKDIHLVSDIQPGLPCALGDENRLQQILHNLVGNAIKFTEKGEVKIQAKQVENDIQISVQDSGIGIAPEHLGKIFNKFEQADGTTARVYGGTGLGLFITKYLVELHGGKIWCESTPQKGTTFSFTLPISDENPDAVAVPAADLIRTGIVSTDLDPKAEETTLSPSGENHQKIFVVDDETINLEVVSSQLRLKNYQVIPAVNGQEALNLLDKYGMPDLMLLDIMMPHMTGLEVCSHVRKKYSESELPIIFLTAKNQLGDLIAGFSSGANDYLVKPFSSKELLARIQNHIKVKTLTSEIIQRRESQARIEKDLDAARAVQETLFFPSPQVPEVKTVVHYKSADKTGGDWYCSFFDKAHQRVIIMIGDVTGHGIPSALITGVVCGTIRGHFHSLDFASKASSAELLIETVSILNRVVRETGYRTKKSITMCFLTIDLSTGELTYLNAGHNPVYRINNQKLDYLLTPSNPIGHQENPAFEVKQSVINPGDLFFLYTDGLIENTGPDGQRLKKRVLEKVLLECPPEPEVMRDRVLAKGGEIWQDIPPDDDCTLFILKWLGKGSQPAVQVS